MTDNDIQGWLSMLAPTNAQRLSIVRDLLKHGHEDRMQQEDLSACVRAIHLLEGNSSVPEAAGPVSLNYKDEVGWGRL